jgi:CTP synthase
MEAHGIVVSGRSADNSLVEVIEIKDHPWFVASQFHPEFKSRPTRPHPLFRDFVGASIQDVREKALVNNISVHTQHSVPDSLVNKI